MSILLTIIGLATFGTYVWMVITAFKKSVLWGIAVLLFSPLSALIFAAMNFEESKKPIAAFMACFLIYSFLLFKKVGDFAEDAGFSEMAEKISRGEKIPEQDMARNALRGLEKMHEKGLISAADLDKARSDFEANFPVKEEVAVQVKTPVARPSGKAKPALAAEVIVPVAEKQDAAGTVADPLLELLAEPENNNAATGGYRKSFVEMDLADIAGKVGKVARIVDRKGRQHIGHILEVEPGNRLILGKTSGSVRYSLGILLADIKSMAIQEKVAR